MVYLVVGVVPEEAGGDLGQTEALLAVEGETDQRLPVEVVGGETGLITLGVGGGWWLWRWLGWWWG